jgi:hypothetical protein
MLDLGVEPLKNGEDGSFQGCLRFIVGIGDSLTALIHCHRTLIRTTNLGIRAQNIKETCDATQTLLKLMTLLERSRDILQLSIKVGRNRPTYLQQFLVLLSMRVLELLVCGDVVLEVANSMLPCTQALLKELRNLDGQLGAWKSMKQHTSLVSSAGIGSSSLSRDDLVITVPLRVGGEFEADMAGIRNLEATDDVKWG